MPYRSMVLVCLSLAACGGEVGALSAAAPNAQVDSIVGGRPFAGLPAVGALSYNGEPMCTATLIGPRAVLTAAHCLHEADAAPMRFVIGAEVARPELELEVAELRLHDAFDPQSLVNDIGLVTLVDEAPLPPLRLLPAMDESWVGTDLFFVGYGVTSAATGRGAGRKRAVWIAVSSVEPTTFEYDDPERNTCYGDSGGPAFFVDPSGVHYLAGLTSWGDERCARFGIDTRVDAYPEFTASALSPPPPPEPPASAPSGDQEIEGVHFSAAEAEAVLALVNSASELELDEQVGLDSRAAANIVAARPFTSLAELAGVPYVGPTALARLKAYACPS